MKSDRPTPVAIIGGGFSGSIVAAHLARLRIPLVLIEGGSRAGLGVAYSTTEPAHLLNVRAESMSAWADEPQDFAGFFEEAGGSSAEFAERRLYGSYLRSILEKAIASEEERLVQQMAVSARPSGGGWSVHLADGSAIEACAIILATGNEAPELPQSGVGDDPRFINNPWNTSAAEAVTAAAETGADVLILGTGLTMIDTVLSLDAAGHGGRIVALSRRGLIPRAHAEFAPSPVAIEDLPEGDLLQLWRFVRRRAAEVGWRAAIDALRPHSQRLWQNLNEAQQRRFLRHARPWWDVHRHRIAPQVALKLKALIEQDRLEIVAARLSDIAEADESLFVRYLRRGAREMTERRFGYVFNCTGPLGRVERSRNPLLRQMLDEQLARPDALGMGVEVDERSRVAGSSRAWAMGPLAKGRFWEIVAVPDIRVQAAMVAEYVAGELGR